MFLFDLRLSKWLSKNIEAGDLKRHRAHYDVIVMNVMAASATNTCDI